MFPHPVGQPTRQQLTEDNDEDINFNDVQMGGEDFHIWTVRMNNLIHMMLLIDTQHVDVQGHNVVQNLRADEPWLNAAGLASVHAAALARLLAMSESDRAVYTIQSYNGDTWQEQVDLVTHLECKWRNIGLGMQDYHEDHGLYDYPN